MLIRKNMMPQRGKLRPELIEQIEIHRYYWERMDACLRQAIAMLGLSGGLSSLAPLVLNWSGQQGILEIRVAGLWIIAAVVVMLVLTIFLGEEDRRLNEHYLTHHTKTPLLPPLLGISSRSRRAFWIACVTLEGRILLVLCYWLGQLVLSKTHL
ncbi:hypothetical protein [Acidocella aromatica]|uniref:Uncharacterized protein n=1 Tax=Acidocella aromatica TaxID=1303579 RepID=A0A840V9T4_9PROT|nr:hypothetical protein [Acidocella aromatica]MBB5372284.1 hypothetical protein [Acidocella aromatica]